MSETFADKAFHATCIDRDYYREKCERIESELAEVSRQLDEAHAAYAALVAERRAA